MAPATLIALPRETLLRGTEVRTPSDAQRVLEMRCGYDDKLRKVLGRVAVVEDLSPSAVVLGYGSATFPFDYGVFAPHVERRCHKGCVLARGGGVDSEAAAGIEEACSPSASPTSMKPTRRRSLKTAAPADVSSDDLGAFTCSACWGQIPAGARRGACRTHRFILCAYCLGELPDIRVGMEVVRGPTWCGRQDATVARVGRVTATAPNLLVAWDDTDGGRECPHAPLDDDTQGEITLHRGAPYADVMPRHMGVEPSALNPELSAIQRAAAADIAARIERAAWWTRVRAATSLPTRAHDPQTGFTLHAPRVPRGVGDDASAGGSEDDDDAADDAADGAWVIGNDLREATAVGERLGTLVTREVLDVEDQIETTLSIRIAALGGGVLPEGSSGRSTTGAAVGADAIALGVLRDPPLDFDTKTIGSFGESHALCSAVGAPFCWIVSNGTTVKLAAPPLEAGDVVTLSVDENGGVLFFVNGVLLHNAPVLCGTYRFGVSLPRAGQGVAIDCADVDNARRRAYSDRLQAFTTAAAQQQAKPSRTPRLRYIPAEGFTVWPCPAVAARGVTVDAPTRRRVTADTAAPTTLRSEQVVTCDDVARGAVHGGLWDGCAVTWKVEALPRVSGGGGGGGSPTLAGHSPPGFHVAEPTAPPVFLMFGGVRAGGGDRDHEARTDTNTDAPAGGVAEEPVAYDTQHLGENGVGALFALVSQGGRLSVVGVGVPVVDGDEGDPGAAPRSPPPTTTVDLTCPPLAEGDTITLVVTPTRIRYFLNACLVCDSPAALVGPFRFAVSLCHPGAAVAICEGEGGTAAAAAIAFAHTTADRREATLPHQLDHGYLPFERAVIPDAAEGGPAGSVPFINSIPSILVSHEHRRAACVSTAHATVLSHHIFNCDAIGSAPVSVSYRLLKRPSASAAVTFGVAPAAPTNYRTKSLGMTELDDSVGLLNQDGKSYLAYDGEGCLVDAPSIHPGDVVTVSVTREREVVFAVNGVDVESAYAGVAPREFRFGVSIIIRGTVVEVVEGWVAGEGDGHDAGDDDDVLSTDGSDDRNGSSSPRRRARQGFGGGGGRLYTSTLQVGREVRAPVYSDRVVHMRCAYATAMRKVLGRTALVEGLTQRSVKLNFGCDAYVFDYDVFPTDVRRVCYEDACALAASRLTVVVACSSCGVLLPRGAGVRSCKAHRFTLCTYCCGVPEELAVGTRVVRGPTAGSFQAHNDAEIPADGAAAGTVTAVAHGEVPVVVDGTAALPHTAVAVTWDGGLGGGVYRGAPYRDVMGVHDGGLDEAYRMDAEDIDDIAEESRDGIVDVASESPAAAAAAPRAYAPADSNNEAPRHPPHPSARGGPAAAEASGALDGCDAGVAAVSHTGGQAPAGMVTPTPPVGGRANTPLITSPALTCDVGDTVREPADPSAAEARAPGPRWHTRVDGHVVVAPRAALLGESAGARAGREARVVRVSTRHVTLAFEGVNGDGAPGGVESVPSPRGSPRAGAGTGTAHVNRTSLSNAAASAADDVTGGGAPPAQPPLLSLPLWALSRATARRCSRGGCVLRPCDATQLPVRPPAVVCTACLTVLPAATPGVLACPFHRELLCPFCLGGRIPTPPGSRVARGPTWRGAHRDGGHGGAGTVIRDDAVRWDAFPSAEHAVAGGAADAQDVVPAVPGLSAGGYTEVLRAALSVGALERGGSAAAAAAEEGFEDGLHALDMIKRAFSHAFDASASSCDLTSVLDVLSLMEDCLHDSASFVDICSRMERLLEDGRERNPLATAAGGHHGVAS